MRQCIHCGKVIQRMADAVRHVKTAHGISPVSAADLRREPHGVREMTMNTKTLWHVHTPGPQGKGEITWPIYAESEPHALRSFFSDFTDPKYADWVRKAAPRAYATNTGRGLPQ